MTRYGICPVCGGTYSVRKGGLMRVHGYRQNPYGEGGGECDGSGRPRKRERIEQADTRRTEEEG